MEHNVAYNVRQTNGPTTVPGPTYELMSTELMPMTDDHVRYPNEAPTRSPQRRSKVNSKRLSILVFTVLLTIAFITIIAVGIAYQVNTGAIMRDVQLLRNEMQELRKQANRTKMETIEDNVIQINTSVVNNQRCYELNTSCAINTNGVGRVFSTHCKTLLLPRSSMTEFTMDVRCEYQSLTSFNGLETASLKRDPVFNFVQCQCFVGYLQQADTNELPTDYRANCILSIVRCPLT